MTRPSSRRTVEYHQPATMSVACSVCGAQAGHQCKTARRLATKQTHVARVIAYNKVSTNPRRRDT